MLVSAWERERRRPTFGVLMVMHRGRMGGESTWWIVGRSGRISTILCSTITGWVNTNNGRGRIDRVVKRILIADGEENSGAGTCEILEAGQGMWERAFRNVARQGDYINDAAETS